MRYTISEKVDMVFIFGECNRIMREACRLYGERFPYRTKPSLSTFSNIIKKFKKTGTLYDKIRNRVRTATNEENTINILAAVTQDPHISVRQLERDSGISRQSVLRILHANQLYPSRAPLHQQLNERNYQKRLQFCEWGSRKLQEDETFLNKILFTDVARFTSNGEVNRHDMHYSSVNKPRSLRGLNEQGTWSVNVWCGILDNKIIGPYFINGMLHSNEYERILTDVLPELLQDVSLYQRQSMWFQQEGCLTHLTPKIIDLLNRKFGDRWIGRLGNIKWPEYSSDLTPMDFYLWRKLEEQVYRDTPTTENDMRERIISACSVTDSSEIRRAVVSVSERFKLCINVQGRHFEHLISSMCVNI